MIRRVAVALAMEPVRLVAHLWSAWIGPGPQVQVARMAQMRGLCTPKEKP